MPETRTLVILGLVGLIALAGCGGAETGPETSATTIESSPTSSQTATDPTATRTTTTRSTVEKPDNPFEQKEIAVVVTAEAYENETRYERAGQAAVQYWQTHSSQAGYDINLVYSDTPSNADVVIQYRPTIDMCGDDATLGGTYFYCGTFLEKDDRVTGTQDVEVVGRYKQHATVEFSKEALGQLLGVEEPTSLPGIEKLEDPPLQDPFLGDEPVVIGINNTVNDRNFTGLVIEAIEYWEAAPDSQKNYSVDFVVRPDSQSPDVEVRISKVVETCGYGPDVSDTLGCAPVLNETTQARPPELIEIVSGYTNETTLDVIKHEFGHLQGRQHGQEPMPLMAERIGNSTRLPQPNATERENPWRKNELVIFADYDSIDHDSAEAKDQVQGAVQYFRDHPEYRPENTTFTFTSNRSRADITITGEIENCESLDGGSCHLVYGHSVDSDPSLEYYTQQDIFVSVDQEENIGWHVGTWLAYTLAGAESTEELPEAFDDPEHDDRSYFWR